MKRKEPPHSKDPIYVGDYEGETKKLRENNYEVFLSFRGKDTRKGFTDFLYHSLVDAGIHVFRDDNELCVGEKISSELSSCIMGSKIFIPIISEDYASSTWCLRELTEMLKCMRSMGQVVLPIFYKVEPSQVRNPRGRLEDAFNEHKKNLGEMVVKEWEEALKEVTSLKGWESEKINNGHEGTLVKMVVRKVMSELKILFQLNVSEQLVGIDYHVEEIMRLIDAKFDGPRVIGIYGMGGIGKTTLAKVLYNNLSDQFDSLSFLENIRETSQRMGVKSVQRQFILDITGNPYDVSTIDHGIRIIKSRLKSKKILVVLDDIDDNAHLNSLMGDGSWFKAGSIVIITTRNKSILDMVRAGHIYELNELPPDQSLILFSRHAFRKDFPPSDYKCISHDVASIAAGLPLALEVIGSFLCGKVKPVWEATFYKLKEVPNRKVQDKLMISFEALDFVERQIFLDIACFFIGSSKQSPIYMWEDCGFFPGMGIEVLSLMSLIKIGKDGKLMMHDQLRDMGRNIVRLENPKELLQRSRVWNFEEAVEVLGYKQGTCRIEALRLDKNVQGRNYTGEQFKGLNSLRFLQLKNANLAGDFQNSLPQLRWLQWERCPSDFIAVNFSPKKLVVLNLSLSGISENWEGWDPLKVATNLKILDLSSCRSLRTTPDLSAFKRLEIVILKACICLEEIHHSLEDIKTLIFLNVTRCSGLKKLPAGVGRMNRLRELLVDFTNIQEIPIAINCLVELQILCASHCIQLTHLPESIGSLMCLTQLDLSHSGIEKLPESIGSLKNLRTLDASWCASLAHIPNSIGNLTSLSLLDLRKCYKLAEVPYSIGSLVSLQRLLLSACHSLREIPDSIGKLTSLTELDLNSTAIMELPESIGSLQNLTALDIGGTYITELPSSIEMLMKLQELRTSGCESLQGLPSNHTGGFAGQA